MKRRHPRFADAVFINCPFDRDYWPIFEAVVFCVVDCGFTPRSALEETDSGDIRLYKLRDQIRGSKYAIHDLSRTEVGTAKLPRFNMPFELGMDMACRFYGAKTPQKKKTLILESILYSYQLTLSDILGQEVQCHRASPDSAITIVRNWLQGASGRITLPGPYHIKSRFVEFSKALPGLATAAGLDRQGLTFIDYVHLIEEWLRRDEA